MCEPTTLAVVSIAATMAATGVSAYGQQQQSKAMEGQASYQAAVARNNAIIAERQAQDALDRGRIDEQTQNMRTKSLIGRQRAALAANGVQVDTGSALDLTTDTAMFGAVDALTIRSNAEREALGFRTQGMNFQAEEGLQLLSGKNAKKAGRIGFASTLAGGATSVASKWYGFSNEGTF